MSRPVEAAVVLAHLRGALEHAKATGSDLPHAQAYGATKQWLELIADGLIPTPRPSDYGIQTSDASQ